MNHDIYRKLLEDAPDTAVVMLVARCTKELINRGLITYNEAHNLLDILDNSCIRSDQSEQALNKLKQGLQ